jgi:hypothetical protein
VHTVVGASGESHNPIFGGWQANEEAGAGYLGASGILPEAIVRAMPSVYRDRTEWRSYLRESGECLWAGEIEDVSVQGGVATVLGKGWGEIYPEREFDHILYESWDPSLWTHHTANPDIGTSMGNVSKWVVEVGAEAISWIRHNPSSGGSSQDSVGTGGQSVLLHIPGIDFYRLKFRTVPSGGISVRGLLQVRCKRTTGLSNDFSAALYTIIGNDGTTDRDVDLTSDDTGTPQGFAPDHVWLGMTDQATGFAGGFRCFLQDLRVSGIPGGVDLSDGGLVRDVAARVGISTDIDDRGVSVLPYYPGDATAGELLDYAALFTGYRSLFLDSGQKPYLEYGSYDRRRWDIADPRQPLHIERIDAYDRIHVKFKYPSGRTGGMRLQLMPSPLDQHRTYGKIELPDRHPRWGASGDGTERAYELADNLLRRLSRERWKGDGQLVVLNDENGNPVSAHLLHAGDTCYDPTTGAVLKVQQLRRTDAGVFPVFDDEIEAVISRWTAREERRIRDRVRI